MEAKLQMRQVEIAQNQTLHHLVISNFLCSFLFFGFYLFLVVRRERQVESSKEEFANGEITSVCSMDFVNHLWLLKVPQPPRHRLRKTAKKLKVAL